MYLLPCELKHEVEFDYAIIDLNLNSEYFDILENKLISLAPEYALKNKKIFPYLLRLNSLDEDLINQINKYDQKRIEKDLTPFFLFKFKSVNVREPDIVEHLKKNIILKFNDKKSLYRFFDPKIWLLLNYFKSYGFFEINKYFRFVSVKFYRGEIDFIIKYESKGNTEGKLDLKTLKNIGVLNRVSQLLNIEYDNYKYYFKHIDKMLERINRLEINYNLSDKDLVVALFHIDILGENYENSSLFKKTVNSIKGYEKASKEISVENWNDFFFKNQIIDEDLRNKVMYDY